MLITIKKIYSKSNFKAVQAFSGEYSIWSMKHLSVRTGISQIPIKYSQYQLNISFLRFLIVEIIKNC